MFNSTASTSFRCAASNVQQRQRQQLWCRRWWLPVHAWPPLALCLHVVMVESGMRAGMAVGRDRGPLWAHSAVSSARGRPRHASLPQLRMCAPSLWFRCVCRCMVYMYM